MDRRILFARFCGWELIDGIWHGNGSTWSDLMFDAENNDTDCMTLVRALNAKGWYVDIGFAAQHPANFNAQVWMNKVSSSTRDHWYGDDYKQGVCALAEKIIRDYTS